MVQSNENKFMNKLNLGLCHFHDFMVQGTDPTNYKCSEAHFRWYRWCNGRQRWSRNQWRHAWTLRSCWRRTWSYSWTSSTRYSTILFSFKMTILSIWNDLVGEALGAVVGQVPQVTQQFCSALGWTLHLYGMTWSPGLSHITQSQESITPPPSVVIKNWSWLSTKGHNPQVTEQCAAESRLALDLHGIVW